MSTESSSASPWGLFCKQLAQQVDGASLALFRICFGLIMLAQTVKYLRPWGNTTLKDFLYDETTFNFTYPGFTWVEPLPEPLWTLLFWVMGIAALGVALGVFYRAAAITLCATYSYIFLSELAKYNNHYYLMCLLALLLAVMPADQRFSIAAWWRNKRRVGEPANAKLVPFWTVFLLRAQLFIVYFYGGIAKFNADWLTGVPMVGKGRAIVDYWTPVLGLPQIEPLTVSLFICWFGLVFDLSIGFLLVFRRTRLLGIVLTFLFHVSNHFLFPIGLFPLMAFSTTLIFFEPDWPLRFYQWLRRPSLAHPQWRWSRLGVFALPPVGLLLGWKDRVSGFSANSYAKVSPWSISFVVCFLAVQIAAPFRHSFIAGDANWTEEGQNFSWRMMLRTKDASHVIFHVADTALLHLDERGRMQFDWARCPDKPPKTLYVPVESSRFNWDHHPGLTATYEPNVGLRAIYHLDEREDANKKSEQLSELWKNHFGRDVQVVPTIGLEEGIDTLEQHFSQAKKLDAHGPRFQRMRERIAHLPEQTEFEREQDLVGIVREMEALLSSEDATFVRSVLVSLHPFLMQGATFQGQRFLVVNDPELTTDSHALEKFSGGSESLVWVDLGRLRPTDWKKLPQWFVTFENRELRVVWNYADDLNAVQMRRFTTSPWMIHQFAGHIADTWESQTGHRPMIRVVSNLMMNYRTPQPLIDPNVDLASAEYSLIRHNEWILPLQAKAETAAVRTANHSGAVSKR